MHSELHICMAGMAILFDLFTVPLLSVLCNVFHAEIHSRTCRNNAKNQDLPFNTVTYKILVGVNKVEILLCGVELTKELFATVLESSINSCTYIMVYF
jgi:hypothetical protein